jgi:hypothetical protein
MYNKTVFQHVIQLLLVVQEFYMCGGELLKTFIAEYVTVFE